MCPETLEAVPAESRIAMKRIEYPQIWIVYADGKRIRHLREQQNVRPAHQEWSERVSYPMMRQITVDEPLEKAMPLFMNLFVESINYFWCLIRIVNSKGGEGM